MGFAKGKVQAIRKELHECSSLVFNIWMNWLPCETNLEKLSDLFGIPKSKWQFHKSTHISSLCKTEINHELKVWKGKLWVQPPIPPQGDSGGGGLDFVHNNVFPQEWTHKSILFQCFLQSAKELLGSVYDDK